MTIREARRAACFKNVAATGWFSVGLAPMTTMTSASFAAANGAVTAPDPMPSSRAATDDAWQRRRAVIDIVGAKSLPHELLDQERLLV